MWRGSGRCLNVREGCAHQIPKGFSHFGLPLLFRCDSPDMELARLDDHVLGACIRRLPVHPRPFATATRAGKRLQQAVEVAQVLQDYMVAEVAQVDLEKVDVIQLIVIQHHL